MDELLEAYLGIYEESEFRFNPERSGPKPSVKPKSRERDIGKHDDWRDSPPEQWGERPPAALKLRRRAKAVTDTQRREDQEVKLRKEELEYILDILVYEGYVDDYDSAAGILEAMSEEWVKNVLMERRRAEKGIPRKPRNLAFELVAKKMGSGRAGVQPRGVKKVPGQKPPKAGEYGSERRSPEQIITDIRRRTAEAERLMHSRFD